MRGTGNPIKKPEKISKILDNSKLLNLNLASNNTDSNNLNNPNQNNIKDRKKTCSQDQNKKSKGK